MFRRLKRRIPETQLVECPGCGKQQELRKGVLSAFCKRCHTRLEPEATRSADRGGPIPPFVGSSPPMTEVMCPFCGRETEVPRRALNALCKHCRELVPLQKGKPVARPSRGGRVEGARARAVSCYECGAEATAPEGALSTMCPKCGRRIELGDIEITAKRQEDLSTCGRVRVAAQGSVEGRINAAEVCIEGEVRGQVVSGTRLVVGSTGRCYGEVVAKALRVEDGAVFVGPVRLNVELQDMA